GGRPPPPESARSCQGPGVMPRRPSGGWRAAAAMQRRRPRLRSGRLERWRAPMPVRPPRRRRHGRRPSWERPSCGWPARAEVRAKAMARAKDRVKVKARAKVRVKVKGRAKVKVRVKVRVEVRAAVAEAARAPAASKGRGREAVPAVAEWDPEGAGTKTPGWRPIAPECSSRST